MEVPAILRIRVFSEQRRVPFEVLTLVDIKLEGRHGDASEVESALP